jgi:outer membrane protein
VIRRKNRGAGTALAVALAAALVAPAALAADRVQVPIGSKARRPEPLPPGEKVELSLQRAIELALRNTLDLEIASFTYEKAAFGIGGAQGAFDPYAQLDLSASRTKTPVVSTFQAGESKVQKANLSFGQLVPTGGSYTLAWTNTRSDAPTGFTTFNPSYSSGLTAAAVQPLLRNFGFTVNRRFIVQARLSRDTFAWDFVRSLQTTVQSVENAYWDLVYAIENLAAKQEALARAKDLNRITRIKIDVGALAPIDIVQTEVTIAQREQDIILAEGLIGDAEDRLKRLMNVTALADWSKPLVPTDRPLAEPVTVDLEAGIRRALETRPEVKQAVVDIESKKVSVAYTKNQLLPRLDLSGTLGFNGLGTGPTSLCSDRTLRSSDCVAGGGTLVPLNTSYVDALYEIRGFDFPAWTVGLTLNVPIGNRTARSNSAIARTDLDLSRTNLALLKENLVVEVRAAARAIDTAFRSVAAARKSRELAERNLDAEKKKYENGMTTSFQVAQIQNDLTTARTNELQAIAVYVKSIAAWHKAIGDILPERSIDVTGIPVTLDATPPEEGAVR